MSLRSKPLELVDELKGCVAPDAGGVFIFMLLRNKPLEIVDELRIACSLGNPAQRASRLRRLVLESLTLQPLIVLRMQKKGRAVVATAAL